MPPFPRPKWDGDFPIVGKDRRALRAHARQRGIPERTAGKLLLATWKVANLGVQKRDPQDHDLIADVIGWFDIVAVQEVNDNLAGLRSVMASCATATRCCSRRPRATRTLKSSYWG